MGFWKWEKMLAIIYYNEGYEKVHSIEKYPKILMVIQCQVIGIKGKVY